MTSQQAWLSIWPWHQSKQSLILLVCMMQDFGTTWRSLIMSTETWYVLVPKGCQEFSDDLMGLIEIPANKTVFHFKSAVLQNNLARLHGIDALALEVCENDSDSTLKSNKVLSECSSGGSTRPFIVRYPGSTCFILFACVATCMHAHSILPFF